MYRGLPRNTQQTLYLAAVLTSVLAVLVVLGLLLLLILLILLVIHDDILRNDVLRFDRSVILSQNSGFILGFENETYDQPADNCRGDAPGGGL